MTILKEDDDWVHIDPFDDTVEPYDPEENTGGMGGNPEAIPTNLNEVRESFEAVIDDWDDKRERILHVNEAHYVFQEPVQLQQFIFGFMFFWDIASDRIDDNCHDQLSYSP